VSHIWRLFKVLQIIQFRKLWDFCILQALHDLWLVHLRLHKHLLLCLQSVPPFGWSETAKFAISLFLCSSSIWTLKVQWWLCTACFNIKKFLHFDCRVHSYVLYYLEKQRLLPYTGAISQTILHKGGKLFYVMQINLMFYSIKHCTCGNVLIHLMNE
jgi:hypothetical protein